MVIKDEKMTAKLTHLEEKIHLHTFLKQAASDDSIRLSFDRLQRMIPMEASLVFLELSLGGSVKGKVYVRLNKDLPNTRDNFIHIVTGQQGPTLTGVKYNGHTSNYMYADTSSFGEMIFTRDRIERSKAKRGDLIGHFNYGYLKCLHFYVTTPPTTLDYGSPWTVFGHVEAGIDVVLECHDKHSSGVTVSDSGLVLEQE
ncbi:unnamed protein product [Meganyctiphanes norvegica]|uniref:PPIase cyclophilin-type domain-containing protein n=1 Tax=Meganyctiphanes norvegica TaxID=48144 RepID=A0AAV2S0V0_MEGNR